MMFKTILIYGLLLGLFLIILLAFEYFFWIRNHIFELYGAIIAILFLVLGLWFGNKKQASKIIQKTSNEQVYTKNNLGISKREFDVLVLLSEGFSNQEIADKLFVSTNTVKTHNQRLFEKLDVKNRIEAIIRAKEIGIYK
jgi:two-component system, NarL family, response regulator LiaR